VGQLSPSERTVGAIDNLLIDTTDTQEQDYAGVGNFVNWSMGSLDAACMFRLGGGAGLCGRMRNGGVNLVVRKGIDVHVQAQCFARA
jgi:hypothetical protein